MNILTSPFRAPLSKLAVAVTAISITSTAMASQSINKLSVSQPSIGSTELAIAFSDTPIQPTAYQLTSPNRLVLDFPKVDSQLPSRVQTFNQGNVKDVTTLTSDDMTRLIVTLADDANFTTRVDNNQLVVNMQSKSPPATATPIPTPTPVIVTPTPVIVTPDPIVATPIVVATSPVIATPTTTTPTVVTTPVVESTPVAASQPPANTMVVKVNPLLNPTAAISRQYSYDGLSALNYNPSGNGGGTVTIGLANESIPVDVQRTGDELVVRLQGATVPNNLLKQVNVGNGLVQDIVTNNQGRNGVIRIAMSGDYEYKAYQTGNQLNISIDPPRKLRQPTLEERTYSGAPLSLEFQDVSVRTILEVLGQHTNTNIVASDSVSGNITLRLINVPWDQALDIILKSKNLDKRVNGNVIWVAPAKELADSEAADLKALQDKQELAPLRTEFIRLNYAKAQSIRDMIMADQNRGDNRNSAGSLLSNRGTVTIDERTNTLIVKDTSDIINNIRDLISKIDIPVKQVMIEARIVSANDSFSKEMGVKWGILSQGVHDNRNLLVGGSDQTLWDLKKYDIKTQTVNGQSISYPSYTITRPDNLNVNLGASNPAGRIAFGLLNISDMLLDLELSAMQADNKGEIISSPKVLTADKQTAKVMSGQQLAYQEASASGATSTSWVEAALSLQVTPNITPEGRIGMQLTIENGSPTLAPDGSLAINKDSINTNVVVDDGQTVVLGGIFKNTTGNGVTKVPFLGDLPYINRLFKRTTKSDAKQELLIFVTPKLINDSTTRIN